MPPDLANDIERCTRAFGGQENLDFLRLETPQLRLVHQAADDDVPPVVEWQSLPRENEEADIGGVRDDFLQEPQRR